MKKAISLLCIFIFLCLGAGPIQTYSVLYDWAFNMDDTTYKDFCGDPMSATGTWDGEELGTLAWLTSTVGDHTFTAFFDFKIDENANTYFNEYGSAVGTLKAGQSWEIYQPGGWVFGDIYEYIPHGALDNYNSVLANWKDDVPFAINWDFTMGAGDAYAEISLTLGDDVDPFSGFHLEHWGSDSGEGVYSSSTSDITPVPEPGTVLLMSTGLAALIGLRRRFKK